MSEHLIFNTFKTACCQSMMELCPATCFHLLFKKFEKLDMAIFFLWYFGGLFELHVHLLPVFHFTRRLMSADVCIEYINVK